jgi:hypothetical protein
MALIENFFTCATSQIPDSSIYITMIQVPEPRLLERLLVFIIQGAIIVAAIVSMVPSIENRHPLMHDPAVWSWNGGRIL